ncbi:MAG TPA: hypothetical protein VNE63_14610 [Candidatus Acidoferrales bacterium]|nr:hypothetical protein [Candidatus Acidoferrales bacterium]
MSAFLELVSIEHDSICATVFPSVVSGLCREAAVRTLILDGQPTVDIVSPASKTPPMPDATTLGIPAGEITS